MLIVHIGLPKTATTFVQYRILARTRGVMLLHGHKTVMAERVCGEFRDYVRAGRLRAPFLRRRLAASLRHALEIAQAEGSVLVVSDENISLHSGGFWRDKGPSPERVAQRLGALGRALGPQASPLRVIFGIRKQDRWLCSRYAESARHVSGFSQEDFERRMSAIIASPDLAGPLGWLDHHRACSALMGALGAENVHVYRLEKLASKPRKVFADMGGFIGNPRLLRAWKRAQKKAMAAPKNVLSKPDDTWQLRGSSEEIHLTPELSAGLKQRFAPSNRELRRLVAASK
jgi:hypothetical protein